MGDVREMSTGPYRHVFYSDERSKAMNDTYHDTRFCTHCDAETDHLCRDSGHERDSSRDWQQCLVCKRYQFGHSGYYLFLEEMPYG